MTSHEFAVEIQEAADYLLSRPEFDVATRRTTLYLGWYYDEKEKFLAAVKALGPGKKKYTSSDVEYHVKQGADIQISVNRSTVCRKVQEEMWECEPLLSPEEEAQLVEGSSPILTDNEIPF